MTVIISVNFKKSALKTFRRAHQPYVCPSSETQGQIVGARESLNGRKNMARRKVKNERREEPLGTMSYQSSSKRSPPFWLLIGAGKRLCFSAQSEARTAATVWNWSGKTLSPGALLAVLYFSSCHIFLPVQTFSYPHYLPLDLRGCTYAAFENLLQADGDPRGGLPQSACRFLVNVQGSIQLN